MICFRGGRTILPGDLVKFKYLCRYWMGLVLTVREKSADVLTTVPDGYSQQHPLRVRVMTMSYIHDRVRSGKRHRKAMGTET